MSRQQVERLHLEVEIGVGPELAEQVDVALAVAAEVEVVTHHDHLCSETVDEHPFHEGLGTLGGDVRRERNHHRSVDTGGLQQVHLLLRRGEQARRRLRAHDGGRMSVERDDGGVDPQLPGPLGDLFDHCAVTQMHTVVRADGDHGALTRPGATRQIRHDVHGRPRYRQRAPEERPAGPAGWGRLVVADYVASEGPTVDALRTSQRQ